MDHHGRSSRQMVVLFSLFLLLVISARPGNALFGGRKVNIWDYPHHAAVAEKSRVINPTFICSGAILSPRIIVTAASCLQKYYDPTNLVVRVGSPRFQTGGTLYQVSKTHSHPKFSATRHDYDVAVLQVRSAIKWNQNVHSVELSRPFYRPALNATVFASSWGSYEGGSLSLELRHAALRVNKCPIFQNTSDTSYNRADRLLCASNYPAKGTCSRDDGAPLIEGGRLVGLATRGGFGCTIRYFSVFVRLSNRDIHSFIQQYL